MKFWRDLNVDEQRALTDVCARLGLGLEPMDHATAERHGFNFRHAFVTGQLFRHGTLYFDPKVASVDDLTHDMGHALSLSPEQRATFDDPSGDIETGEAAAMLVQWAIARAALPDYDLAASLDAFGYNFGEEDHSFESLDGKRWADNLGAGRVIREELAVYCHLQALGLVSAPPTLRPAPKKAQWDIGAEWAPTWAEILHRDLVAQVTQAMEDKQPKPLDPVKQRRRRTP